MPRPPHEQILCTRDALDALSHAVPRDLARDVMYYLREARNPELATDVLVDGLIELRIQMTLDEFERLRTAMDACGRGRDRRLHWLEDHGLKPLPTTSEDDDFG